MSAEGPFAAFYASDLQAVWGLQVAPALYLAFRAARRRPTPAVGAARFVSGYCLAFAVLTIVDPLCTGPLARALGGGAAATGLSLFFVLLGDFRVYWLVFALSGVPRAAPAAALASLAVPLLAFVLTSAAPEPPPQVLYAAHELLFVGAALGLRRFAVPRAAPELRPFLADAVDYVLVYYALWALADVLILGGADAGFALRVLPNQLYYALFVPFVHWRFFASASAPASTSAHASR